tara:strand:- start:82 stop:345 length:264 start_codon:yes stop_codon:yes gene_type:complete
VAEEVDHKVVLPLHPLEMMEDQVEEERMYLSVQLLEMEMFLLLVLLKEILVVNILLLEEIGEQVQVVELELLEEMVVPQTVEQVALD